MRDSAAGSCESCRSHACASNLGQLGCHVEQAAEDAYFCFADAPQSAVSAAKLAQIQYKTVPLENDGMDCRADIPDLEPGLDYLLRVSAVNAQGPSSASEPGLRLLTPCTPNRPDAATHNDGESCLLLHSLIPAHKKHTIGLLLADLRGCWLFCLYQSVMLVARSPGASR